MFQAPADWVARRDTLPTALQGVVGYYADTGVFDPTSLRLKRRADAAVDGMIADAFADVENALAAEFGYDYVSFSYDTKLVMPAKLTLGYCYRHADDPRGAREVTRLSVEALVDGDMRDAINDDEYEDFEVDFDATESDRERIAAIAQDILQSRVDDQFSSFDDEVREAYDWAVEVSERHQDEDDQFRSWLAAAEDGDDDALAAIRDEYRDATFAETPDVFTEEDQGLPYLKTQYDRVGVIYDGMIEMYRLAGLPIEDAFKRSIVYAIIGAQIWLDDVDDYRADRREGQLTPVTAEYLLGENETAAYDSIVAISERYFDRAKREATAAESTLTGIATEYIYRDGTPEVLPGSRQ